MKHFKFVFQNPHFMIIIDIYRLGYEAIESYKRDLYYCPLWSYFEVWRMNLFVVKKIPLLIEDAQKGKQ